MALDQNDPDNQGPRSDFEVFRVPSKEMLEKYSESPKDLTSPNPSGGTDTSEKKDFGLVAPAPKPVVKAPEIVAPKQTPPQPIMASKPEPVAPKAPIQPIAPKQETEDMFSEPLATDLPEGPKPPMKADLPELKESPEKLPIPKSRKWLWLIIIAAIVLIPAILLAIEWFGVYSFGFSKYLGSPPAKLVWSRTKINFSTFSTSFSGTINFKTADLPASINKWATDNHYDQKTQVNFSGSLIKTDNVISGTWSFESDPSMLFRIENKKLYIQRQNGQWYSLDIGVNNIDTYFELIQSFFVNSNNFTALKPSSPNIFSYKAKISNQILGTTNYLADEPSMTIDLKNKDFSLQKINLSAKPVSGADLQINFNDFNNESVELANINEKSVLPGSKEFSILYNLFNLLTKSQTTQANSDVTVTQTEVEKNDAKRKADLAAIAELLESYKADHNKYPIVPTKIKIESNQDFIAELTPYLVVGTTWNYTDPLWPAKFYGYESTDGTTYSLTAALQNTEDTDTVLINDKYIYTVAPTEITP